MRLPEPLRNLCTFRWNLRGDLLAISEGAAAFGAIDFGTRSCPIVLVERKAAQQVLITAEPCAAHADST